MEIKHVQHAETCKKCSLKKYNQDLYKLVVVVVAVAVVVEVERTD